MPKIWLSFLPISFDKNADEKTKSFFFYGRDYLTGNFHLFFINFDPNLTQTKKLNPPQQHLNCKILHGGKLLQPWPNAFGMRKYFSGNHVFPSPKSSEDQKKKVFTENWRVFVPEIKWRPKKKGLHRNSRLNSAGICGICSCCLAIFRLFNQSSNLDGGTLNFDGGRVHPTI